MILTDYRNAPISEKLRGILGFLEKITTAPHDVSSEDVHSVLRTGVTPQGIKDALHVAALFNLINRLADAFGFAIPDDASFVLPAKVVLRFGYRL
jgi:alkylhydroperoxidase family enzyme